MIIQRNLVCEETLEQSRLLVLNSGYVCTDDTWHQKPLPVPFSRLYFITEGSGVLVSDRDEMKLEPGFVYIAPCGCQCGFYGTDSVTKLFFHINVLLPNGYDLFASAREFARLPFTFGRMEQLRQWYFGGDIIQKTLLKGALWETVAAFAGKLSVGANEPDNYSASVRKAIAYIRENLRADLLIRDVADAVYCSVGTLTQSFRQEVGVTIARYIEDLVMQEAQILLLVSNKTVGQISAELGFCDQFYFTRRFSKRYLITPREYRKSHAKL